MQYRCPQCQSPKIIPVSQGTNTPRPVVPKSLVFLIPAIFILLLLVVISISMWIFGDGAGSTLQMATIAVFIICLIAGFLFWRDCQTLNCPCRHLCNPRNNGSVVNVAMSGRSKP